MSAQRAAQLVEAGLFLRLSGDLDGARRLFEQALRLDPTNGRARQLLEGGSGPAPAPRPPPAQGVTPLAAPLGNAAPAALVSAPPAAAAPFAPPAVAPATAFEDDWGSVMDGGPSAPAPAPGAWNQPRTTAPVAPMGAPVTTTMAFPLNEARQLPFEQQGRAPMGAPATSTMAYPMAPQPERAPMGAPPTSTMAYQMSPQAQPAPQGAPATSTMAFPMSPQGANPGATMAFGAPPPQQAPLGAPATSTMAYQMSPQAQPAPQGAPPTSTMAFPMSPQGANPGATMAFGAPRTPTGWTPPPPPAVATQQRPEPPAPWGAPSTSTMAFPMSPQQAAPQGPADPWGQPAAPQSAWGAAPPAAQEPWSPPTQAPAQPWGAPAKPPAENAWGQAPQPASPWDAPAGGGWGAPPTTSLGFGGQKPAEPAQADPWAELKVPGAEAPAADPEAAMWGAVSLSSRQAQPQSYAPPAVADPFSPPAPAAPAEDDWSSVRPSAETPTAPLGLPTVRAEPPPEPAPALQPAVAPAVLPAAVAVSVAPPAAPSAAPPAASPAPGRSSASSTEVVPWDAPEPVSLSPRPRPQPVAFADWAQPSEAPAPAVPGPWSTSDTPVPSFPAPPQAAPPPATAAPLGSMLSGGGSRDSHDGDEAIIDGEGEVLSDGEGEMIAPPAPAFAPAPAPSYIAPATPVGVAASVDEDIEVVEEGDEAAVAAAMSDAPPPMPALPPRPEAAGIPEPSWEDPAIDAVVEEGDTLDQDFGFSPPPPPPAEPEPPPAPPDFGGGFDFSRPTLEPEPEPVPVPPAFGGEFDFGPPPPLAPAAAAPAGGYEPSLVQNAQSAWDSNSNPGMKLKDAAPKPGDAFDLIQKDEEAKKAVAPLPEKKDTLSGLLRKAKDLIGLDDHTGAMALITQADALAPNDAEVKQLKERSEATLQRMYESKIGNLDRIPRVKLKETEIIWLNLDHRAGFMLAQVDGSSTFEDLFALSGMSRLDTARILAQLIDEGVIVA